MRKLLLLLGLILIYPAFAKGQGYLVTDIALNQNGRPIPSPTVTVCAAGQTSVPCTSLVSVFSNAALTTPVANPLPICTQTFQVGCADVYGNYSFYITPGTYTYTITGQGTTLQGPFVITVPCVVGGSGCGGGTVGPGTVNQVSKFTPSTTTIGNSSITDDGSNPSRLPNGANSAGGGFYAEWVVDTGGVTANHLACRSSNNKAVICPAGTTQGVLGVAQATVSAGGTALVCFAGKCNVVSSNATTAGHWLIPSASIDGDVDDTGSTTKPTTGVQSLPAETSVAGGNAVLTTFLSPDTLNAAASAGTINPCGQYGIAYYSAAGSSTTLSCITPPTANGRYSTIYDVNANAAVAPSTSLAGVVPRTVSGTPDTILYSDRSNRVIYTSNSAVAVTVPQPASTGFTSNTVFRTEVNGNGLVTFTPTSSTVNGAATFVQTKGQSCTWYTDNSNYTVKCWGSVHGLVFNIPTPIVNSVAYLTDMPVGCTIVRYAVGVDAGTITVKFLKIASGTALPTISNSINTSGVGVSSGQVNQSTTLSDFTTTTGNPHDIYGMIVTAVSGVGSVQGVLSCAE